MSRRTKLKAMKGGGGGPPRVTVAPPVMEFDALFESMQFPAGEPHVRAKPPLPQGTGWVLYDVRDWNGIAAIIMATKAARRNGCSPHWVVPYFPFGRAGLRRSSFDTDPLYLAIRMLDEHGIPLATIDPHDELAAQMPHWSQRVVVSEARKLGALRAPNGDPALLLVPDAGAAKKAHTWRYVSDDLVQCLKHRDPETGKLEGFRILAEPRQLNGRHCVIVDDICDGGGTFLGLAKVAGDMGAASVSLVISHGLFTNPESTAAIASTFTTVHTLDCYLKEEHPENFRGIPLLPVIQPELLT